MTGEVFPHLSKAPATEAVIEFRTRPNNAAKAAVLTRLAPTGFSVEELREYAGEIELTPAGPRIKEQVKSPSGFRLLSPDGRVVVSATLERVATSRLYPYIDWSDLLKTAREFWDRYVRLVEPQTVVRLGVRYINRLDLPTGAGSLREYLEAPPSVFPGTAGPLKGFVKRAVTAEDDGITAIVTQALQESYERRTVLILDIDCSVTSSFEAQDAAMWTQLSELRVRKNRIFFGNLTERGKALYA